MIKTFACIAIDCDACADHLEVDGVTMHAGSVGEHTDFASTEEWFIADDGRALCRRPDDAHRALADEWRPTLTADELERLRDIHPKWDDEDDA